MATFKDTIEKALADAAKAEAEAAAADAPADVWDLLDPDPQISGPAWERWKRQGTAVGDA
jgi:hypothetical protein